MRKSQSGFPFAVSGAHLPRHQGNPRETAGAGAHDAVRHRVRAVFVSKVLDRTEAQAAMDADGLRGRNVLLLESTHGS